MVEGTRVAQVGASLRGGPRARDGPVSAEGSAGFSSTSVLQSCFLALGKAKMVLPLPPDFF